MPAGEHGRNPGPRRAAPGCCCGATGLCEQRHRPTAALAAAPRWRPRYNGAPAGGGVMVSAAAGASARHVMQVTGGHCCARPGGAAVTARHTHQLVGVHAVQQPPVKRKHSRREGKPAQVHFGPYVTRGRQDASRLHPALPSLRPQWRDTCIIPVSVPLIAVCLRLRRCPARAHRPLFDRRRTGRRRSPGGALARGGALACHAFSPRAPAGRQADGLQPLQARVHARA